MCLDSVPFLFQGQSCQRGNSGDLVCLTVSNRNWTVPWDSAAVWALVGTGCRGLWWFHDLTSGRMEDSEFMRGVWILTWIWKGRPMGRSRYYLGVTAVYQSASARLTCSNKQSQWLGLMMMTMTTIACFSFAFYVSGCGSAAYDLSSRTQIAREVPVRTWHSQGKQKWPDSRKKQETTFGASAQN